MSIIGTSVAAGVAGSAHTAQQVARQRDKQQAERQQAAQRLRDLYETQLRGIEEPDAADSSARVHIDDQMPENENPHDAQSYDVLHRKSARDGLHGYRDHADAVELSEQAQHKAADTSPASNHPSEPTGPTYPPTVAHRFKQAQPLKLSLPAEGTAEDNPRLDVKA